MSKMCQIDVFFYAYSGIPDLVRTITRICPPVNAPGMEQRMGAQLDEFGVIAFKWMTFGNAEQMNDFLIASVELGCASYIGNVGELHATIELRNLQKKLHWQGLMPPGDVRFRFADDSLEMDQETCIANPAPYLKAIRGCLVEWAGRIERVVWVHQ